MKPTYLIWIGLFLAFAGIGIQVIFENQPIVGSFLSTIGVVLAIRGYLNEARSDRFKKDERTRKISAWAASYSWMITIVGLMIFFWVNYLGIISLTVNSVIWGTYILLVGSLLFFKWFFDQRGDVDEDTH